MLFRWRHPLTHKTRATRLGVVLVVDDDPANRDLACRMLGTDYLVQSAADECEAARLAANTHPDVMVVTGTAAGTTMGVLRALRYGPEAQRIPVVVRKSESSEMPEGHAEAVAAVMQGPLSGDRLRMTVATVLANR